MVSFRNYQPIALNDSMTAAQDIMLNPNTSQCPINCFRPVGLAFDSQGRLFMSSDATGEIYVITKSGGGGLANATSSTSVTSGSITATSTLAGGSSSGTAGSTSAATTSTSGGSFL